MDIKIYKKEVDIYMNEKKEDFYIEYICTKIKFYESELKKIKNKKSLFFQKNKLKIYNYKITKFEDKINKLYIQLEEEISFNANF